MNQKGLNVLRFFVKSLLFVMLLYGFLYLTGQACLRVVQKQTHKKQLFYADDFRDYQAILLGDSVFTSCYTDTENQSLWIKIADYTGLRTFPGALDAAKICDIRAAATYLADKILPNTLIIIDITPLQSFHANDRKFENNFFHLIGYHSATISSVEAAWNYIFHPILSPLPFYRNFDLAEITLKDITKKNKLNNAPYFYNRKWDLGDTDFAQKRYTDFWVAFDPKSYTSAKTEHLSQLVETLAPKTNRILFVFTPLNRELIHTFSKPAAAEALISTLERNKDNIEQFLQTHNLAYIDTFDSVPSEGFADLIHTNALGDDIMARKIAGHRLAGSSAKNK